MKRYRTSLCCCSGMSYRMARTLSRIAKLGEKAVARSNCTQNRNILFKCPRWSDYVKKRNWAIAVEVQDVGSGATTRVQREKLIEAARRREIDCVLVWRLGRWWTWSTRSRN